MNWYDLGVESNLLAKDMSVIPGRKLIGPDGIERHDFLTIDYLGLSASDILKNLAIDSMRSNGFPPYSSPIYKKTALLKRLEEKILLHIGFESIALFSNSTVLNGGVIRYLSKMYNNICIDNDSHASLRRPLESLGFNVERVNILGNSGAFEFPSGVLERGGRVLIGMDGVGGMSGRVAPVECIRRIDVNGISDLYVDDSHGFGVLGSCGEGNSRCLRSTDYYVGSLNKTMACPVSFIASNNKNISRIVSRVFEYGFSGSMPDYISDLSIHVLDLAFGEFGYDARLKLKKSTSCLMLGLLEQGWSVSSSPAGLVIVDVRSRSNLINIYNRLLDNKIVAAPIAYPAVHRNCHKIRFSISSAHSFDAICDVVVAMGGIDVSQIELAER